MRGKEPQLISRLYTIYDTVAEEPGPVFEAKNDGTARRAYKQVMNKTIAGEPEEYSLIFIGEFDKETLKITAPEVTKVISIDYGKAEE